MKRFLWMAALAIISTWAGAAMVQATEPAVCPHCGKVHGANEGHASGNYSNGNNSNNSNYGLPRGRRYYNNRYFGNFNNRYYGPQYGYF